MSDTNTENVDNKELEGQETNVDNATDETSEPKKTFTQTDVDKLIGERLKRERSKAPAKEELDKFKEWKKTQQSEQERIAEERKELEATKSELSRLRNEKEVLKNGVDNKFTDYVTYEVSKMDGDFAENLTDFLNNNPHFSTKADNNTTPNVPAGGKKIKNEAGQIDYSKMSDAEYYRSRNKK